MRSVARAEHTAHLPAVDLDDATGGGDDDAAAGGVLGPVGQADPGGAEPALPVGDGAGEGVGEAESWRGIWHEPILANRRRPVEGDGRTG